MSKNELDEKINDLINDLVICAHYAIEETGTTLSGVADDAYFNIFKKQIKKDILSEYNAPSSIINKIIESRNKIEASIPPKKWNKDARQKIKFIDSTMFKYDLLKREINKIPIEKRRGRPRKITFNIPENE